MNNFGMNDDKNNQAFDEQQVDFKGMLSKFFRKWYYFAISVPIFLLVAFIYVQYATPIYQVKSTIFISENEKSPLSGEDFFKGMEMFSNQNSIDNEIGILSSFNLVHHTLRQLDFGVEYFEDELIGRKEIYRYSPFLVSYDSMSYQIAERPFYVRFLTKDTFEIEIDAKEFHLYQPSDIKSDPRLIKQFSFRDTLSMGEVSEHPYLNFVLVPNPLFEGGPNWVMEQPDYLFMIRDLNVLTKDFLERLSVKTFNKDASILELTVEGPVVEKQRQFLNKHTEVYLENEVEQKNLIAQRTIDFIDRQLSQVADSLEGAERKLENFKESNNILNLTFAAEQAAETLRELKREESQLLAKDKYYRYLLNYLEGNSDMDANIVPSTIDIQDPLLSELITKLQDLTREKVSLNFSVSEENYELQTLNAQIRQIREQLIENVRNIINSSEIQLTELRRQMGNTQSRINRLPSNERNLAQIQRLFELNDNLYNYLLEKRAEAGIAKASNMPDNKVLDYARQVGDKPVAPKPPIIFAAAFLLSIILPVLVVLGQDFLNDKVMEQEQIENITHLPIVGVISRRSSKEKGVSIVDTPSSQVAEAFRSLRVNLQFVAPGEEKKVIGITSTVSTEGKTFCSSNLATILAISGKKVILVGADLRKPKLYEHFNLKEDNPGLTEYLIKEAEIEDIIQKSELSENLSVINSGMNALNPSELFETPRFEDFVNTLKEQYDYVIIDTPPVGLVSDFFVINRVVDVTLYVVRHNYSKLKFLYDLEKAHRAGKIKNVSIIFNGISRSASGYGYGYGYGSSYSYSSYSKSTRQKHASPRKKNSSLLKDIKGLLPKKTQKKKAKAAGKRPKKMAGQS